MADEDIEKLVKNLSPQEKIKKLKELQKKNQEEIEKAQKLLKKSEEEAEQEEELKKIVIPQLKAENIEELFSPEEKELFKAKRFISETKKAVEEKPKKKEKSLEDTAEEAKIQQKEVQKAEVQYISQLSQKPAEHLYNRTKEIYNEVKASGYMSANQQHELDEIHYANAKKMHDMEMGKYADPTREAAREMVLTEKMRGWLQDSYGRKSNY